MACGTTLMGYTQWCCSSPDCCHTKKVCFRCKSRSCPRCGVKAGAQWIQYLLSLVPGCPWQHMVFTLPCQYWSLVFHNQMYALGVLSSYSRSRTSNDNPYSESFFRTIKYCPWWSEKEWFSDHRGKRLTRTALIFTEHYGHHGRRPTAGLSGFYRCPAPGPGRGYHRHGLYRASAHTGAVCHTAAPLFRA